VLFFACELLYLSFEVANFFALFFYTVQFINHMKTKTSFARFYMLLAQLPGAEKEELIWQYSNMLTTSLQEFYTANPTSYEHMLQDMEQQCSNNMQEVKFMRSAVLKRMQQCGVDTTKWSEVNKFLAYPQIAGKMLFEMSVEEMQQLIPKLEKIIAKNIVKRKENQRLMQCN